MNGISGSSCSACRFVPAPLEAGPIAARTGQVRGDRLRVYRDAVERHRVGARILGPVRDRDQQAHPAPRPAGARGEHRAALRTREQRMRIALAGRRAAVPDSARSTNTVTAGTNTSASGFAVVRQGGGGAERAMSWRRRYASRIVLGQCARDFGQSSKAFAHQFSAPAPSCETQRVSEIAPDAF